MKPHITLLVEKIYKSPSEEVYNKLLTSYIHSENYLPYEDLTALREKLDCLVQSANHQEIIKKCYDILKVKPYDIEAHILAARFSSLINKPFLSSIHNYIANIRKEKLLAKSGDSISTAIKIIYPEDELFIFRLKNLHPLKRLPHEINEQFYDVYSFKDEKDCFFDITMPFIKAIESSDEP